MINSKILSEEFEPLQSHRIKKLGATRALRRFFFFFKLFPCPEAAKKFMSRGSFYKHLLFIEWTFSDQEFPLYRTFTLSPLVITSHSKSSLKFQLTLSSWKDISIRLKKKKSCFAEKSIICSFL